MVQYLVKILKSTPRDLGTTLTITWKPSHGYKQRSKTIRDIILQVTTWSRVSCTHHDQLYLVCFIFEILITTFNVTLFSLQTLPHDSPCSPSNPWPLFHWLLLHVFLHTYIFLDITCWVHIMLLVCMCSGLTGWHGTTNLCSLLWRGPTLPTPAFLSFL